MNALSRHPFAQRLTFAPVMAGLILAGHLGLFIAGVEVRGIDSYFQVMPSAFMAEDFWGGLLYFHAFPPLLSVIHWLMGLVTGGQPNLGYHLLLPLLHAGSSLLFYRILKETSLPPLWRKAASLVIFLNPLFFIYFLYPFYSAYLFCSSLVLLYALVVPMGRDRRFLMAAGVFSFNGLLRASYPPVLILLLLAPLVRGVRGRSLLLALLLVAAPLGVSVKNWVLFDAFAPSTWSGFNSWRHIPLGAETQFGSRFPRTDVESYRNSPIWPRVEQESEAYDHGHPILHTGNINDYRLIVPARIFMEDAIGQFDFRWSLEYGIVGIWRLLESPASETYNHLEQLRQQIEPARDLFDLPNYEVPYWGQIPISVYTVVYPLAVLFLLFRFHRLAFGTRYLLAFVMLYSFLYAGVDNEEAMRMRFELEPLFLFLTLGVLDRWRRWEFRLGGGVAARWVLAGALICFCLLMGRQLSEWERTSLFDQAKVALDQGDDATARQAFLKLAAKGHRDGEFALGDMSMNGKGVTANLGEAFWWHRRAAQQGHRISQARLGTFYVMGWGTAKDREKGLMWLRRSARQGFKPAVDYLKRQGLPLE